jgi:predicted esterase
MKTIFLRCLLFLSLTCGLFPGVAFAAQARFFEIDNARILTGKRPNERLGIEARIHVAADSPLGKCYVRAYFFDSLGKQITAPVIPNALEYEKGYPASPLPVFLRQNTFVKIRLQIPEEVKKRNSEWRAVLVFGDDRDASATLVKPSGSSTFNEYPLWYDFPERPLCTKESAIRPKDETRLMEIRCNTTLQDYPFFTLFARLPEGVKRGKEAKGILCLSLLAYQINDVRMSLLNHDAKGEVADMIRYADANKLLVLCWGSRNLWDASKNWDELPRDTAKQIDARFDSVATAWESGVKRLAGSYGFETKNFLLWGYSGSAQYAMRLALRKPQYFSAVVLQIPSSFDEPTKEAAKVLWCLATGELESGYIRSQKFLKQCRFRGYRFVYKAVPGLGHRMHWDSMRLGMAFFDYARTLPPDPKLREETLKAEMDYPEFVGDWLNQNVETKENTFFVPYALKVPLPTKKLAQAWEMRPSTETRRAATAAIPLKPPVPEIPPPQRQDELQGAPVLPPPPLPAANDEYEDTPFGRRKRSQ